MIRSFVENGGVQIRSPESGGKIEDLGSFFDAGKGTQMKIPTEILIPETREFELPMRDLFLCHIIRTVITLASSANSALKITQTDNPDVNANLKVNSRLNFQDFPDSSLSIIQRENIGTTKVGSASEELNKWIKSLVTEMPIQARSLLQHIH